MEKAKAKGRVRLTKWKGAMAVLVHFHGLSTEIYHCRLLGLWYTASSRKYRIRLLEIRSKEEVKRRGKPKPAVFQFREFFEWQVMQAPDGASITFAEERGVTAITIIAPTTPSPE